MVFSGAVMLSVNGHSQWSQRFRMKKRLAPDRNSATFPWRSWAVASAVRAWTWKKFGRKKKKQKKGHNGMPQSLSRIGLTERLRIEILTNQASDCTNLTLHQLSNYWLKLEKNAAVVKPLRIPTDGSLWPHVPGNRRHPHDASRDRWFTPNLWPASSLSLSTCRGSQQTD